MHGDATVNPFFSVNFPTESNSSIRLEVCGMWCWKVLELQYCRQWQKYMLKASNTRRIQRTERAELAGDGP